MLAEIHKLIAASCIHTSSARNTPILSATGSPQDWLIDLRRLFLNRTALELIAAAFWERYRDHGPFQIGGMEAAAVPLLTALLLKAPAERSQVNSFIICKERKTHGLGNAIEGEITDVPIILVDDILNSGRSAEKARAVIAAAGHSVSGLFAVIDYHSQRGTKWRDEHSIAVRSLFVLNDFGLTIARSPYQPEQRYRERWKVIIPGANPYHLVPKSAALLAGSRLFRGSDSGAMHCFDAESGTILWTYQTKGAAPRKGILSSPLLHNGQLYFGAYNGVAYCLDPETGAEVWTGSYCEWIGASPVAAPKHGLLFIGLEYERPWGQGGLAALDLKTGQKMWERPVKKFQHGSPAYWEGGDLLIWGSADHEMTAFEPQSGKPIWSFQTRRPVKYAPAIDEQRRLVAFASFDCSIYVLDAATGKKRGEWETGEICYTTPLFTGNRLFCGSGDRHLYVIDLDDMALAAKLDMKARVYSSPREAGGRIIFGTAGGRVIEINAETLEIEGILQLPDAITNAVALTPDGRQMFVSTYMNHLFAFERLP
jgi:outer membrane protein assembly factor BamB/orotate phosphoribosyltransferase